MVDLSLARAERLKKNTWEEKMLHPTTINLPQKAPWFVNEPITLLFCKVKMEE
jgi:hypothetical protein